jgi:hypothetical protein
VIYKEIKVKNNYLSETIFIVTNKALGINGVPHGCAEFMEYERNGTVRTKSMGPTRLSAYILSISGFISVLCPIGYGVWAMKKVLECSAP